MVLIENKNTENPTTLVSLSLSRRSEMKNPRRIHQIPGTRESSIPQDFNELAIDPSSLISELALRRGRKRGSGNKGIPGKGLRGSSATMLWGRRFFFFYDRGGEIKKSALIGELGKKCRRWLLRRTSMNGKNIGTSLRSRRKVGWKCGLCCWINYSLLIVVGIRSSERNAEWMSKYNSYDVQFLWSSRNIWLDFHET